MIYTLTTPIEVGDFANRITITQLKLTSVSFNFQNAGQGVAILSVCLADPVTGYPVNVVYQNADALAFWSEHSEPLENDILQKLMADNKLPSGSVS